VLVALPEGILEIIEKELKGKIGDTTSDMLRTIIISYLSEKGYMAKKEGGGKK
jgi:hypothetical protein